MDFLPDDYEAPKTSGFYMRIQDGENRFRILSAPIFGWEDWVDKKPIRYGMDEKPEKPNDPKLPFKHFWAFIVYNYNEQQVQILQITQATIRKRLEQLCRDKDWGSPYAYDIKIFKRGTQKNTEYDTNPVPHKPVEQYIADAFEARPCNLNALFSNENPFAEGYRSYTPMARYHDPATSVRASDVPFEEIADLKKMFEECDPTYKEQLLKTLANLPKPVKTIEEVPSNIFEKIRTLVKNKRDEYQRSINPVEAFAGV